MRTVNDFLDSVLDKRRTAEAHGMKLDIMVLHVDFHDPLMKALAISPALQNDWELRQDPNEEERKDLFIHGVKVMWSGNRLPTGQAWFRYSNPNFKPKGVTCVPRRSRSRRPSESR